MGLIGEFREVTPRLSGRYAFGHNENFLAYDLLPMLTAVNQARKMRPGWSTPTEDGLRKRVLNFE